MRKNVTVLFLLFVIFAACVLTGAVAEAQETTFTKEDLIKYTPMWKGERFEDGRPKVSDEILEKMKTVVIDDAILIVKRHGFMNQYDDGYEVNQDYPVLVGRAVTGVFMPLRPDVTDVILANAEKNEVSKSHNGRIVETLVPGDIVVADLWGDITNTFAGGGVSGRINKMTEGKGGLVINGGVLDKEEIHATVPDFTIYSRGWHPTHLNGVMLTGVNCPVRMGTASVMPGDVVLGGYEGVLFIPPHLAQEIVDRYAK
ncbi:RraA family protein [Candidatus Latescibacterota bacterium]